MIKLRYVFGGLLCIGLLWKGIEGCSGFSSSSSVRKALKAGELSEAVEKCNASTSHEVSSDLLDALLKVGQVDKAKMLLQRLFPEDDRFWGFRDNYARASYTKLYKALIAAGRYDDAWECHELDTNDPNDAMNAKHYYTFMVDVVTALELQAKMKRLKSSSAPISFGSPRTSTRCLQTQSIGRNIALSLCKKSSKI